MIRLSTKEKAEFLLMVKRPEKQGVAITHNQLRALMIAQIERDNLADRLIEDGELREDDAGYLSWTDSGESVAYL